MTKSEIEKLIEYIDNSIVKLGFNEHYHNGTEVIDKGVRIYCKVDALYNLLREYPVEPEKTCGPDYQGMYEVTADELRKAQERMESIKFDMHNLSIEHAHYVGAVAVMETIFGRKFEPYKCGRCI